MNPFKRFFRLLNQDSMTETQQHQRYKLLSFTELIIVVFLAAVTISDYIMKNGTYFYFSLVLLILYAISFILVNITKGKGFSNYYFCAVTGINFLYSFYIKGNTGIGSIWLLLLPLMSMFIVGLGYGFFSSLLTSFCLLLICTMPFTREDILTRYSPEFLSRYILLFYVDFILSTIVMYSLEKLRIKENEYQKELEKAVIEEHNKVVEVSMETIIAISNAVEAKDLHVGKHSQRVAYFSCLIAEKLGWSEKDIQRMHTIAILHDIGKIGVDSRILNKEDALDDEEYELLKEHTTIGGKILKDLTIIPRVDLGANYHHEHYDGLGYPEGLVGDSIPIEARIVCIADSFDAMKYSRIYKKALTVEEMRTELKNNKGKHFDPVLADIFLQICEENNWFDGYEVK